MKVLKKFLAIPALVISAALYHKVKDKKKKKEDTESADGIKEEEKKDKK